VVSYAVSLDDPEKNKAFAESIGGGAIVLSDTDKKVSRAYGVLALGGLYAKRVTFVIDSDGIVRSIDDDVEPASHGPDLVRAVGELLASGEPPPAQ
jgi:peroxiredoxin Q/BCP